MEYAAAISFPVVVILVLVGFAVWDCIDIYLGRNP